LNTSPQRSFLLRFRRYALAAFLLAVIAYSIYSTWRWTQANHAIDAAKNALGLTDFDEAKKHLDRADHLRPENPDVQLLLAEWARRVGKLDEAAVHLRACDKAGGVPEAIDLERILARAQQGQLEEEAILLKMAENEPSHRVLIYEAIASGAMKTYRLHLAAQCLDRLLKEQPRSKRALAWKGETLYLLRTSADAIATWKQLIEIDPDNDEARLKLAATLVEESQPDEALVHYLHLRGKGSTKAAVAAGLARCWTSLGKTDDARDLLDASLRIHSRDPETLLLRGRIEFNRGRADQAEPWLRKAAEAAPFDLETVYALGQCLTQLGKKDEAKSWLDRHRQIQDDQLRLTKLTRQTAENPRDPDPRTEAGIIFLRNGNAKEGLRWLRSALHESPDHIPTHQALAKHYRDTGLTAQAEFHERAAAAKKAP
jgi:tetratricopeptide (TPR) repeat protein